MSIVKMQRLRLIALAQDRDALLDRLLHAGCVELSEPTSYLADEDWARLLHRDAGHLPELKSQAGEFRQALEVLAKVAPYKGGMFTARGTIRESELLDEKAIAAALEKARDINGRAKELGQLAARETRLEADRLALRPWESYDLPLEEKGTRTVSVLLGSVPNSVDFSALSGAVAEAADAEVKLLSTDREQHCLEVLVHRASEQAALEALRGFGFSFAQLKELKGTVKENLRALELESKKLQDQRQKEEEAIRALGSAREELQVCVDRLRQYESKEDAKERLLTGGSIVYLDGWSPVEETEKLKKVLAGFECAWELTEPEPEEYPQVPIKLKNNIFTRCMNTVTEMYSLPAYDGVDPNPLMAPFFILFFGMMMADIGYGILMILGTQFVLRKTKPKNPHFMELFFWCGVS
ncbi:MAG: V-type ATP synthase subunit I, partial [Oscillospiraceae bacterium]|nr:V-type ATP synthase subunit I [Oscillospiraceae bacterium]